MTDIASVSAASVRPQNQARQLLDPARAKNLRVSGAGSAASRRDQVLKSVDSDVASKQVKNDAARGLASSEQFHSKLFAQKASSTASQPTGDGTTTEHSVLLSVGNLPSRELTSITAAGQAREFTEALVKRDGVRAATALLGEKRAEHVGVQQSLIDKDFQLGARRGQDLRDDLSVQRDRTDLVRSQVRAQDTIAVDNRVQQIQRDITGDLNFARDTAEIVDAQRLNEIASAQSLRQELGTVQQRDQSFRQQQNDLEARVIARRAEDQSQTILQETNLRSSIERIRGPQHAADNAARGALLDVSA